MKLLFAAALAVASLAVSAKPAIPTGPLPDSAAPLAYELALTLDPARADFDGRVRIHVELKAAADHLWLHGKDLQVKSAQVAPQFGAAFAGQWKTLHTDGASKLSFGRRLAPQKLWLTLDYRAPYNTKLEGIHKVSRAGEQYVVTQMEPISARLGIPSFDEPRFKTPWTVSITAPERHAVAANAPALSETNDGAGWKTVRFAPTPPLPTYLLALAVGPWDVVEAAPLPPTALRPHAVPLRALTPKGQGAKVKYALDNTRAVFEAMENYFGVAYPYAKLDIAAIPDFSAGAMENAGLITYRDQLLLVDENSPLAAQQAYFFVHAHEIAHQWFGNLVTMHWWDDLWLNEAFASWMASKVVRQLRPADRNELSTLAETLAVMAEDSLSTARRIQNPIASKGDIEQAFDGITYDKGNAVLTMFETWVGEEKFRTGVRDYIRANAWGNARSSDLIGAIEKASSTPGFASAFTSFLTQPGVPEIAFRHECSSEGLRIHVKQSRYAPLGSPVKSEQHWELPLALRMAVGPVRYTQTLRITKPEQSVFIKSAQCPDWILPNAAAAGYYRFTLSAEDFARIAAQVPTLEATEQMVVADALLAGFARGTVKAQTLLDAVPAFASSPLPQVATALFSRLVWLHDRVMDQAARENLRARLTTAYAPSLQRLGLSTRVGESADDTLLRQRLANTLGATFKVDGWRAPLCAQADRLLADPPSGPLKMDSMDGNLLPAVLRVLAQDHGTALLPRAFATLEADGDPVQRVALLRALALITEPALAEQVRAFGLTRGVKTGEAVRYWYNLHFAEAKNEAAGWIWAQKNYEALIKRAPSFAQSYLPETIAGGWCDTTQIAPLEKFFSPQRLSALPGAARSLKTAAESIRLCAALKAAQ